ncbi:MAG: stalk domain-containing protein [Bacillota bacterium]|nr:stalk domain-containing protein [Bacillota bacterium]
MRKKLCVISLCLIIAGSNFTCFAQETYKYDNSWEVTASSSIPDKSFPTSLFDGKTSTYWHTDYRFIDGTIISHDLPPFDLTVVFPDVYSVSGVILTPRSSNSTGLIQEAEFYGSSDGVNFSFIKKDSYSYGDNNSDFTPRTTYFSNSIDVKAIKIVVTKSLSGYAVLSGLDFIKGPVTTDSNNTCALEEDEILPSPDWIMEADSEVSYGKIENAFDSDFSTIWHTNYITQGSSIVSCDECPHTILVTFPIPQEINGIRYYTRRTSNSGIWKTVSYYGRLDGENFKLLASDTYTAISNSAYETNFEAGQYKSIKIVITESIGGYGTASEIRFLKPLSSPIDVTLKIGDDKATINGESKGLNAPPVITGGCTMVPVRFVSEALGAYVGWTQSAQTVSIALSGNILKLPIGSFKAYVNGRELALSAPAVIINGYTMVPVRFVSEALGAQVFWNGETQTVSIKR